MRCMLCKKRKPDSEASWVPEICKVCINDPGLRPAHIMISLLAGAQLLRIEVLDRDEIDRDEIVNIANNLEKYTYELAHLTYSADVDEWKAELERKRDRTSE